MARSGDGMAILREAASSLPCDSPWHDRIRAVTGGHAQISIHLAVFVGPFLDAIIDRRKTIESRFGAYRCTPFEKVHNGDIILLKRSGGPVVGLALAGCASYYELTPGVLGKLRGRFASQLCAEDDGFWAAHANKRFASLIEIDDAVKIDTVAVEKHDRRGWITYDNGRQHCLALAD
jgi:hypothetical protein